MPRIAWFSPFSSSRQLRSAHFSSAVLSRAPQSWDVEVFVDDASYNVLQFNKNEPASFLGFPVYLYHRAFLRHEDQAFDAVCFQREDAAEGVFIEEMMRIWPGVAFYHDMSSTELESSRLAHATTSEAVVERAKELGEEDDGRLLGDLKARGWETEVLEREAFDCTDSLKSVVVAAPSVSRFVDDIASKNLGVQLSSVGFPMKCVPDAAQVQRSKAIREEFSISKDTTVITVAVRYPLEDRLRVAVEAVHELRTKGRDVKLLWISETSAEFATAAQLYGRVCRDLPEAKEFIIRVDAEQHGGVLELLDVADIHCALKFSLVRGFPIDFYGALARGVPALVSRFGNTEEIPSSAVCKISIGEGEHREFVAAVEAILSDRSFRNELKRQAQAFVETVNDPGAVFADVESIVNIHSADFKLRLNSRRKEVLDYKLQQYREAAATEGVDEEALGNFLHETAVDFEWQLGNSK